MSRRRSGAELIVADASRTGSIVFKFAKIVTGSWAPSKVMPLSMFEGRDPCAPNQK